MKNHKPLGKRLENLRMGFPKTLKFAKMRNLDGKAKKRMRLRIALICLFGIAFSIFLFHNASGFRAFRDLDNFLCRLDNEEKIHADITSVRDDTMNENEKRILIPGEDGLSYSCFSIKERGFYRKIIKNPRPSLYAIGTKKEKENNQPNAQSVPIVQDRYIFIEEPKVEKKCFNLPIRYNTKTIYEEGPYDREYTIPGTNGTERICDGVSEYRIEPIDEVRVIIQKPIGHGLREVRYKPVLP